MGKPGTRLKNRLFRSNVSGRFDNYDGTGTQTMINWERSFARGGVGAIISSYVPVHVRGRIMPNYAMIDTDDKVPLWRAVGKAAHRRRCKYILQLSHSDRQHDNPGVENFKTKALSSTNNIDTFHVRPSLSI
jgi:2,4-dienoyl-CoA reductase-like NADH-dependent reductase (Old Yellow Enzyme family)